MINFVSREEFEKEYPSFGLKVSECRDKYEPKLISSETNIHRLRSEDDSHEHQVQITTSIYKCNCGHEHISQHKIIKRCECGWVTFHIMDELEGD